MMNKLQYSIELEQCHIISQKFLSRKTEAKACIGNEKRAMMN